MHQSCRYSAILLLANLFLSQSAWGQTPPIARSADPPTAKTFEGLGVTLKIESTGKALRNELDVLITFTCAADARQTHRIRNVAMSQVMDLPGDLVIRNANGSEVNRITDRKHGSRIRATERDYVSLPPGKSLTTKVRIEAAHNLEAAYSGEGDEWIGNGEFTLQFEMNPAALGLPRDRENPIVRSEAIKFELGKTQDSTK